MIPPRVGHDDTKTTTQSGSPHVPLARILVVFDGNEPRVLTLPEVDALTIGRGADADIRVDDPSVSRVHARFRFGMHATLEDLDSSNGTFIGSTRLTAGRPAVIATGVTIQFGKITCVFHLGASQSPTLIGTSDGSAAGARVLDDAILRIAQTELSVLLIGETGVGKNVLARRVHDSSRRAAGPYVVVGASTLERRTLDRTLRGASGGTLVIDEPSDIDPATARLFIDHLSVMENPPRLVATSQRDLRRESDRVISPDLYHRLAGISVVVPPLRKRVHEIAPLAHAIAADSARAAGRSAPIFSADALAVLERQTWPGNVRELTSCIASVMTMSNSRVLTASHFSELQREATPAGDIGVARVEGGRGALREARERMEYQQIIEALRSTRGNQTQAAEALGISRSTLLNRLAKYGVPRPRKS